MTFPLAGLGAASSSAQAKPLSFGLAPSFSPAPSQFGAVSSAAAATPSLFSAASLAPIAVPPLFGAASPGAPASFQLASSIAAPQPGGLVCPLREAAADLPFVLSTWLLSLHWKLFGQLVNLLWVASLTRSHPQLCLL